MDFEKETKEELRQLSKNMDLVLRYLHNDSGTGEPGLISAFKKHEIKVNNFIEDYEKQQAVRNGKIKIISIVFGSVGTGITLFLKWVLYK
jgi:hypothetical protein